MSVSPVTAKAFARLDAVARQRLAPGHRAHQPHQRRMCVGRAGANSGARAAALALRIRICAESRTAGVSVSR